MHLVERALGRPVAAPKLRRRPHRHLPVLQFLELLRSRLDQFAMVDVTHGRNDHARGPVVAFAIAADRGSVETCNAARPRRVSSAPADDRGMRRS